MVWMKTYCFHCSVRLGVIVSGTFSITHGIFGSTMIAIFGPPVMNAAKHFIKRKEQYDENMMLWNMVNSLSNYTTMYVILFHTVLGLHIIASVLAIYGAVKLQKWFLIPYVVSQSLFIAGGIFQHIVTTMILKNIVSLEVLIGCSLIGCCFLLFLGYSVISAVALFQIIILVNSPVYKELYGENPLAPEPKTERCRRMMKDVNIFFVPSKNDFNPIKEMISKQKKGKMVLPVKPVGTSDEKDDVQIVTFSN